VRSRVHRQCLDGLSEREKNPFHLAASHYVVREGYDTWTIADIARRLDKGQKMMIKSWCRLGQDAGKCSPLKRLVVMRLPKREFPAHAGSSGLTARWPAITKGGRLKTLFANLKTKGFNLEDTHITDPEKLSTLLALTVTLCVETGVAEARLRPIHIKKHGRRAWSLFALGVGVLRKIIVSAKPAQIIPLLQQLLSSKLPVNTIEIHRGLMGVEHDGGEVTV